MKKILSILIGILLIFTQVSPVFAYDYDFSDEAQAEFERAETQEIIRIQNQDAKSIKTDPQLKKSKQKSPYQTYEQEEIVRPNKPMTGTVVVVPQNQSFDAVLQSSISSMSLTNNDIIAATLSHDWYYAGILIAPQGSVVYGHVTDIKKAGYAYSDGRLAMTFDEIMTPAGDRIRLTSNKVYINIEGKRAKKIAGNVVVGALGGLVSGVLYSLITGGDVVGGLAVGSAIGAAGGAVTAVAHKGEEAEVPAGTVVTVRLVQPIEIVPYE